jgi:methionine-rich copper-binding protein CopC
MPAKAPDPLMDRALLNFVILPVKTVWTSLRNDRRPDTMSTWRLKLLASLLTFGVLALSHHATQAHSELRASEPANGARLTASPSALELRFNEKVQVTAVRLFDASGKEVPVTRDRSLQENAIYSAQPPSLSAGSYRIEWRAISADGHPVGGAIRFTITP